MLVDHIHSSCLFFKECYTPNLWQWLTLTGMGKQNRLEKWLLTQGDISLTLKFNYILEGGWM